LSVYTGGGTGTGTQVSGRSSGAAGRSAGTSAAGETDAVRGGAVMRLRDAAVLARVEAPALRASRRAAARRTAAARSAATSTSRSPDNAAPTAQGAQERRPPMQQRWP
jgi:hypothetical protein